MAERTAHNPPMASRERGVLMMEGSFGLLILGFLVLLMMAGSGLLLNGSARQKKGVQLDSLISAEFREAEKEIEAGTTLAPEETKVVRLGPEEFEVRVRSQESSGAPEIVEVAVTVFWKKSGRKLEYSRERLFLIPESSTSP